MILTHLDKLVLWAISAQIVLTLALLIWMGILRVGAVNAHKVRLKEVSISSDKYPEGALKAGNAFNNQFQIPILFYFGSLLLYFFSHAMWIHVGLAWGFVALRYAHAIIHITNNNVSNRFGVYLAGVFVLTAYLLFILIPLLFDLGI